MTTDCGTTGLRPNAERIAEARNSEQTLECGCGEDQTRDFLSEPMLRLGFAPAALRFGCYAFHTWPGRVLMPAMALRVSTMHGDQSANC